MITDDLESKGPAVLIAHVLADTIPLLNFAALDLGRKLYGPDAHLVIEASSNVTSRTADDGPRFRASIVVRCVNYDAIHPPIGTGLLDEVPGEWSGLLDLPGIRGEDG